MSILKLNDTGSHVFDGFRTLNDTDIEKCTTLNDTGFILSKLNDTGFLFDLKSWDD